MILLRVRYIHIEILIIEEDILLFLLGPAAYYLGNLTRMGRPSVPSCTINGRSGGSQYLNYKGPGPGAYSLPVTRCYKSAAPSYSFGIRHSWRKIYF